jgi:hypothetical protein
LYAGAPTALFGLSPDQPNILMQGDGYTLIGTVDGIGTFFVTFKYTVVSPTTLKWTLFHNHSNATQIRWTDKSGAPPWAYSCTRDKDGNHWVSYIPSYLTLVDHD